MKHLLLLATLLPNLLFAQDLQYAIPSGTHISSLSSFSEGLAKARLPGDKIGFVNRIGLVAIKPAYTDAGSFHEGLASVEDDSLWGFIDKKGRLVIPARFEEAKDFSFGRAAVKKNGIWMYIDKAGREVLNDTFVWRDSVSGAYSEVEVNPRSFYNGLLAVKKGGKFGYVDTTGHWKIPPSYTYAKDFSDGIAVVGLDKAADAIIDTTGSVVSRPDADALEDISDGMILFQKERWGVLDKTGKVIIPPTFANQPFDFSEGLSIVQVDGTAAGNKDGYLLTLDAAGRTIAHIPLCDATACIYDSNHGFHGGLLAVKVGNAWGYMDKTGKMIIKPQFQTALNFQEGIAVVENADGAVAAIKSPFEQSTYDDNLVPFSDKAGKWGYLDTAGKLVIAPRYDNVDLFQDGFAQVANREPSDSFPNSNGHIGWIDTTGWEIFAPQFITVGPVNTVMGESLPGFREVTTENGDLGVLSLSGDWIIPPGKHTSFSFYDAGHYLIDRKTWVAGDDTSTPPEGCVITRVDRDNYLFYIQKGDDLHNGLCKWSGDILAEPKYLEVDYLAAAKRILACYIDGVQTVDSFAAKMANGTIHDFKVCSYLFDQDGTPITHFLSTYQADHAGDSIGGYELDGKYHFFRFSDGKPIPEPVREKIPAHGPQSMEGSNGKYGMVDAGGKVLTDFKYDNSFFFEDGVAEVYADGKQGVIDTTGKEIIPLRYTALFNTRILDSTDETYYRCEQGERWGLLSATGSILLPFAYGPLSINKDETGQAWVQVEDSTNEHVGVFKPGVGLVVPPMYDLVNVYPGFIIVAKRNGGDYQYQLLNAGGKALTGADYSQMAYEYGYLSCQKGALCGVLDTSGKVTAPFRYDYLWGRTERLLMAQQGKSSFYIDKEGKEFRAPMP